MIVKKILEDYKRNKERVKVLEKELEFYETLDEQEKDIFSKKRFIEEQFRDKQFIYEVKAEIKYLIHQVELGEVLIELAKNEIDRDILKRRYFFGVSCNNLSIQYHLTERAISKKIQSNISYIEGISNMERQSFN
ncbi:MAG: hypothetical protein ACRCWG_13575 [Sarcina sp.]